MSEPQSLQFDRVEYASPSNAATCTSCRQQIVQSYYDVNGRLICSQCHQTLTQGGQGSSAGRILRALAAGFGVAIVGAVLWWGVRKLTGYEVGLISIAIGVGVGKAVRWGSQNRGGWAYQLLAILLTYSAVAGNYMPDVLEGVRTAANEEKPAATASAPQAATAPNPAVQKAGVVAPREEKGSIGGLILAFVLVFFIAAAAPFLAGASNIIGILIIGFGLYEAWKINKRVPLTINGPFSVAPAAPPPNV